MFIFLILFLSCFSASLHENYFFYISSIFCGRHFFILSHFSSSYFFLGIFIISSFSLYLSLLPWMITFFTILWYFSIFSLYFLLVFLVFPTFYSSMSRITRLLSFPFYLFPDIGTIFSSAFL